MPWVRLMLDLRGRQCGKMPGLSAKTVYSDKFSVIINALQMRMVCRDFTNFVQDGLIFKGTADDFYRG